MTITEEKLKELLSHTGDTYNFDKNTTFIKEQNITVESGANFYNGSQQEKNTSPMQQKDINAYTMNELREIVNQVMPMIGERVSYFFSVIKVFMWKGKIEDHNFDAGVRFINDLYPHLNLGKKEQYAIARYDTDSFYKTFDRWTIDDAPVKGKAYKNYWDIADKLLKLL